MIYQRDFRIKNKNILTNNVSVFQLRDCSLDKKKFISTMVYLSQ